MTIQMQVPQKKIINRKNIVFFNGIIRHLIVQDALKCMKPRCFCQEVI